jgi:hypothetical protein
MNRPGVSLGCLLLLALSLGAPDALAQSAADKAAATALFHEARQLMESGDTARACLKFQESQRLDPGGGTLLNLAVCHEKEGKTATAWAEFNAALGLARRDNRAERVELAGTHIASLEPRLSKLSIVVPAGSDLPGLQILRDGTVLGRAAWGSAIPVDPGEHTIEAKAPGRVAWATRSQVGATPATVTVNIPQLAEAPKAPPPLASASAGAGSPGSAHEAPAAPGPPADASVSAGRVAAYVAFGLSASGLVAGTIFGLRAFSLHNSSTKNCPTDSTCTAEGVQDNQRATTAADVSTFSFSAALFTAGLGSFLLLYERRGASGSGRVRVSPHVGTGSGGLSVTGGFLARRARRAGKRRGRALAARSGRGHVEHVGAEHELLARSHLGGLVEHAVLEEKGAALPGGDTLAELREIGLAALEAVIQIEDQREHALRARRQLDDRVPVGAVALAWSVAIEPEPRVGAAQAHSR